MVPRCEAGAIAAKNRQRGEAVDAKPCRFGSGLLSSSICLRAAGVACSGLVSGSFGGGHADADRDGLRGGDARDSDA